MLHLPILRAGRAYRSLQTIELRHVSTGKAVATVSQANPGLIARDLKSAENNRRALQKVPVEELLAICGRAAELFVEGNLPVDPIDGVVHSPTDYVEHLSATTGMPHSLCRANMQKIRHVLAEMKAVLGGLTRGIDLSILDRGHVMQDGRVVACVGQANNLGVILPSNSPGVHSLWVPAVALKVPLVLKPGRQEPWTPIRICQALLAAGCPPEAIGLYPADYPGATEILLRTDRSMLFGDEGTVRPWQSDPGVQAHGPGWSKVLLGPDASVNWRNHLDTMVSSIADNGGRSCLNASGVRVTEQGRAVAEALATRLVSIEARAMDDPQAKIAAFADPAVAQAISDMIDRKLEEPGAEDLTAKLRPAGRVARAGGCTFLLPTVIWCEDPSHSLAAAEFMFPFVSVAETRAATMVDELGPTLVCTVLTDDADLQRRLFAARHVDRLNIGPIPTSRISWDQPHEGNLFEHLYRQRAFQEAAS